jgi:hypothetical protein
VSENVNHPAHYGGEDNPYETIKVIDAWDLNFYTGNAVKYISRAGKKNPVKKIEDLDKAIWYLQQYRLREQRILDMQSDAEEKLATMVRHPAARDSSWKTEYNKWSGRED